MLSNRDIVFKIVIIGISLTAQGLRLYTFNAGSVGLIPGWGSKISHAMWHSHKKKKKRERERENPAERNLLFPNSPL